jgi:nitrate reductase assembly molybdenum cofactor insertion protein NarJ
VSTVTAVPAGLRSLARAFADALDYPHASPVGAARGCLAALPAGDAGARELVEAFVALAERSALGPLQEAYTRAFDLDTMSRLEPTCYPYVGHYLFDESHKRGAFILELRKRFRERGFEDGSDLDDHLVVLLRFLAVCDDEGLAEELVDDAIRPALARMGLAAGPGGAASARDAYVGLLRALELALGAGRAPLAADPAVAETEREWVRDRDSLGISRDWCGH